ncbi:MAG: helix-turn-helix transcriptional regulator [Clostridia bacterium]|nr:helix-turn-helix transcriptional regulator [Clostridia bacterium]
MKNSTTDIGKRIKAVRTEKKMTQNELCGTEITRNHLSLIESGKSLPSIGTLCYIAERLDIPVGFFFSDDKESEAKFANLFAAEEARQAYTSRDHAKCIEICKMIPSSLRSDEMSFMLARSYLASALISADRLELSVAINNLKLADETAKQTCYLSADFSSAIRYYELLFNNLTRGDIPLLLTDIHEASSYVPPELIIYMKMLLNEKFDFTDAVFTSSRHRKHADALRAKRKGDYESAFAILSELSALSSLPYYMRYHVYNDLELCADRIGEFKSAYAAAKKKLELMNM